MMFTEYVVSVNFGNLDYERCMKLIDGMIEVLERTKNPERKVA